MTNLNSFERHQIELPYFLTEAGHTPFFVEKTLVDLQMDVSLLCCEYAPSFAVCTSSIAHIHWDYRPMARRISRWADNVARGKDDRRQSRIKTEFIEGGTIGPAP